MESSCPRSASASPPTSVVAPVAVKAIAASNSGHRSNPSTQTIVSPQLSVPFEQQQRLQQIYHLAIAERLRLASVAAVQWPRPDLHPSLPLPPIQGHVPLPPPHPAYHHLYPYRFMVDPRTLYRVPEEPKPQHSYIGLIAMAILSVPDNKLVLSDIYSYILENYAYFRTRGPGWRNSIRHNLSLNDCFIKSGRSANGKGHYWAIHPANIDDFRRGDFRRRRAQRRVRRHMGLTVDDDSSPEPPAASPPPLPVSLPSVLHALPPPENFPSTLAIVPSRKRQFDVASLLAPDEEDRDRATISLSRNTNEDPQHIKRILWGQGEHHIDFQLLKSRRIAEDMEETILKSNPLKEEEPSSPPNALCVAKEEREGPHEDPQTRNDWIPWPWRPQISMSPAH